MVLKKDNYHVAQLIFSDSFSQEVLTRGPAVRWVYTSYIVARGVCYNSSSLGNLKTAEQYSKDRELCLQKLLSVRDM